MRMEAQISETMIRVFNLQAGQVHLYFLRPCRKAPCPRAFRSASQKRAPLCKWLAEVLRHSPMVLNILDDLQPFW